MSLLLGASRQCEPQCPLSSSSGSSPVRRRIPSRSRRSRCRRRSRCLLGPNPPEDRKRTCTAGGRGGRTRTASSNPQNPTDNHATGRTPRVSGGVDACVDANLPEQRPTLHHPTHSSCRVPATAPKSRALLIARWAVHMVVARPSGHDAASLPEGPGWLRALVALCWDGLRLAHCRALGGGCRRYCRR